MQSTYKLFLHNFLNYFIGWGRTSPDGPESDELRQVGVDRVSTEDCNTLQSDQERFVEEHNLCFGNFQYGGKDACQVSLLG